MSEKLSKSGIAGAGCIVSLISLLVLPIFFLSSIPPGLVGIGLFTIALLKKEEGKSDNWGLSLALSGCLMWIIIIFAIILYLVLAGWDDSVAPLTNE